MYSECERVGKWRVSTVKLMYPYNAYETMVFKGKNGWSDHDCERYKSLKSAKAGHKRMVEKWRNK